LSPVARSRTRADVLDAARPLPLHDEMIIEELSDAEDQIFLAAIFDR
jgi:hypothetical protein